MQPGTKKLLLETALLVASQIAFYFGVRYILNSIDSPGNSRRSKAKGSRSSSALLERLGARNIELSEHEQAIAAEVILPEDVDVTFAHIGGLDHIIDELRESVILPLAYPDIYAGFATTNGSGSGGSSSSGSSGQALIGPPKGVLLYGPPGCGKSMLAKALARESGATFINLHMSTLLDKWFGESNRLVSAVFSLARKLAPSIVFIDEIDSFLRDRKASDHETTAMMKAEFMSLWDGLVAASAATSELTGRSGGVVVLGATNRPNDIDAAILRRMPKRFFIKPPTADQRRKILEIMLHGVKKADDLDLAPIVARTDGFSGSDLKELCRNAAMIPVREYMRTLP
ncbi:ATPase, partial [Ramicandelaber brevisporus]